MKTKLPRRERKKTLYKLVVARTDITSALDASKMMLENVRDFSNKMYYPLLCTIAVCYARPFIDNKTLGPLPGRWRKFSDTRLKRAHDELIVTRNKIIAHSDTRVRKVEIIGPGAPLGETSEVCTGFGVQVQSYYIPMNRFPDIHDTCLDLGTRLNQESEELLEELYDPQNLPENKFELRIDNDT